MSNVGRSMLVVHFFHVFFQLTAPNTLLLSSITDSEETDSAPEAASEQPQRQEKPQQFSPQRLGIYTNISLEAAKEVQLTSEQCNEIEFNTRGQSSSPRWLQERKGRITGSVLQRVAACRTAADGLVAEIMGYIKTLLRTFGTVLKCSQMLKPRSLPANPQNTEVCR